MSTAAPWMGANQTDAPEHTELIVTLIDGESITIKLGTWDAENLVRGIFTEHFLRVRKDGKTVKYIPAAQIKSITPGGPNE
jgi:hypothetical protein